MFYYLRRATQHTKFLRNSKKQSNIDFRASFTQKKIT